MARRAHRLTARLPDGYVKTIVTATAFTHYWRIVATLADGRTEVFWGHVRRREEAAGKQAALAVAARQRGWRDWRMEIVALEVSPVGEPGATDGGLPAGSRRAKRRRD